MSGVRLTKDNSLQDHTGNREGGDPVLLTGAADGCLHCVDHAGRVLSICEVMGNEEVRGGSDIGTETSESCKSRLSALAVGHGSDYTSIFCGFSDGSVHVVSVARSYVRIAPCTTNSSSGGNSKESVGTSAIDRGEHEVIQMTVVLVIPPPYMSIPSNIDVTAICWVVPALRTTSSTARSEKASSTSAIDGGIRASRAKETGNAIPAAALPETGILVCGDSDGCIQLFRVTIGGKSC